MGFFGGVGEFGKEVGCLFLWSAVNLILRYFYLAHISNFSRSLTGKSWLISLQGHSAFEGWYFWHASKFESHLTALSIWAITIFSPFCRSHVIVRKSQEMCRPPEAFN